MYQLEKYHGKSSRHECPKCHDKQSFTYYVDENGNPLDTYCGRCNHESGCGYHYTPAQYLEDHESGVERKYTIKPKMSVEQPKEKPLYTIPFIWVKDSASYRSAFVKYLCSLFDRYTLESPTIKRLGELYALGATNDMDVIFWQIDINGKVRTGKIIKYGDNGHRIKDGGGVNWIHAKMKKDGLLSEEWELTQCLFGEHLLNLSINVDKVVAVVEAEKTALIGAACFPQYVWLATGGKSQLSVEKMKVLAGRKVLMFPDSDGFDEWEKRAKEFAFCDVSVSRLLEDMKLTDEQREAKIDIADLLEVGLKNGTFAPPVPDDEYKWLFGETKTDLEKMIETLPDIQRLIDELQLVPG